MQNRGVNLPNRAGRLNPAERVDNMDILVYNDGELVHAGSLESFLADNGHDEWLTEECKKLETMGIIEFSDISGDWLIKKECSKSYVDTISEQYGWPKKIKARGYIAYLWGVQPLNNGLKPLPIYRFPGGCSLVSECEMVPVD